MTPQQIAEAQKLARECQARNFKNCDWAHKDAVGNYNK
jgi:hypothetical protein